MIITERKMKNSRRYINKISKYFINLVYLKDKIIFCFVTKLYLFRHL